MNNNTLANILLNDEINVFDQIDACDLNDKKILITGASGLIGTHLIASLIQLKLKYNYNIYVVAIVNNDPEEWFKDLLDVGNFAYIKGDLTNINFINSLLSADCIMHCATYGQPIKFIKDATKTILLNTSSLVALLNKLKPNGKFLFMSTSEIYSGADSNFYTESDIGATTPSHERACYIEAKRCGEAVCHTYIKNGIDVKIVRICLAYGSGAKLNDDRALNSFIIKGLRDKQITLLDSGLAKRTYIYISDAVKMMWNILLHGKDVVYNVGGVEETDIKTIANQIGASLNVPVAIPDNEVGLKGSPMGVKLDITKYYDEFGNFDMLSMKEGINLTVRWYNFFNKH